MFELNSQNIEIEEAIAEPVGPATSNCSTPIPMR